LGIYQLFIYTRDVVDSNWLKVRENIKNKAKSSNFSFET
jgi:hypothetical protein